MLNTTTTRSISISSEADMCKSCALGALQLLATALANSPLRHGQPTGYRRAHTWRIQTLSTGGLDFVFEAGMGYERYVDYALGTHVLCHP